MPAEVRAAARRRSLEMTVTYTQVPGTPEEEAALLDVLADFLPENDDADGAPEPDPAA